MNANRLTFDDVVVGQEFQTDNYLITAESIKSFASEFDPQAMHLDEDAAATGPFGRLTASGWHTLALAMKLMAEAKPFGSTSLVGIGVDEIKFLKPVFAETSIYVDAEVVEKRASSKPERGFVRMQLNVKDRATEQLLVSEIWTVMMPRLIDE